MDKRKLLEFLKKNPKNVRFEKLCNIAISFNFKFKGGKGSHRIYIRDDIEDMLNFQNVGGKAKQYQVK